MLRRRRSKPLESSNRMTIDLFASSAASSIPPKTRRDLIFLVQRFSQATLFRPRTILTAREICKDYHNLFKDSYIEQTKIIFVVSFALRFEKMGEIFESKTLPSKPWSRRAKWNIDSWAWEVLSCTLSIITTFIVGIIVFIYDGKPVPRLPFNLGVRIFPYTKLSFRLIVFSWILSFPSSALCRKALFYWQ